MRARPTGNHPLLLLCAMTLLCGLAGFARAEPRIAAAASSESAAPHDYRHRNFDYFVSGDPRRPRATRTHSLIALFGGGGRVDAAFKAIAQNAGGGHIVILGAVSDGSFDADDGHYGTSFEKDWGPVVSAETIIFHNRNASSDPRVIAAIRGADGIFLRGGDQSNYLRYWKGTPVQDALNDHVRNHRPIGGSSAGLAVLGRYSYTAMDGGSLESRIALADPFSAAVTLESDFLHCPWLDRTITDTHFSARSRLGRLITFVARINHADPKADAFGIGVDEETALLIDEKGVGQLADGSAGVAWLVQLSKTPRLVEGKPLSVDDVHVTRIGADSRIAIATRTVTRPSADTHVALHDGHWSPNALVDRMMARDVVPPGEN